MCQASGLQNSERFLFPEMAGLWYIIAATSGSQQILLKTAGASVPLRRWQTIEEAAFLLCCREGNWCGHREARVRVCFNPGWAELAVSSGRHFNTFTSVREKKAFGPVSEIFMYELTSGNLT